MMITNQLRFYYETYTLFGASFVAVAADHPIVKKQKKIILKLIVSLRSESKGTTLAEIEKAEKIGFKTGVKVNTHILKIKI